MAKAGSCVKVTLRCAECKQRNYNTMKNKKNTTEKLELSKYCPFCRKHQARWKPNKTSKGRNDSWLIRNRKKEISTEAVKKVDKNSRFSNARQMVPRHEERAQKKSGPTPKQTANNTAVCLVVMVVSALVLWGFDSLADQGVQLLLKLGGG